MEIAWSSKFLFEAESEALGKLQRLLTQRTRKPNERHSEQRTLKKCFMGREGKRRNLCRNVMYCVKKVSFPFQKLFFVFFRCERK